MSSVQCIHKLFYLSKIYFFCTCILFGSVTSVLRHFRPTVLPSYDTSELLQHRSYDISVLRYFRPTIHWSYCNIGPTTAVGRMYIIFCWSDLCRNCKSWGRALQWPYLWHWQSDSRYHPELTRGRCIWFLLFEINHALVYNSTIFKLTILSLFTFSFKTRMPT